MEFKQLQSFVAVVDYGSFTRASEKLFISQPYNRLTDQASPGCQQLVSEYNITLHTFHHPFHLHYHTSTH